MDSLYCIPAITPEKERLARQYAWKQTIYGLSSAVPECLVDKLSDMTHILDVAAGTCVWTFHLANAPQVKPRLLHSQVQLYACDINTKFFPEPAILDEYKIKAFEQDVTKEFPTELREKFDLVHLSFLGICLTQAGWDSALENCKAILKPGGYIFIDDFDPVMYHGKDDLPDISGHDLQASMSGNSWINKLNCLYTGFSLQRGFITDLTYRLPSMLKSFNFTIVHSELGIAPFGKRCVDLPGSSGASMADYEDSTVDSMTLIFEHEASQLLKDGILEVPSGNKISCEDEMRKILAEIHVGMTEGGSVALGRQVVAQRA